MIDIPVFAEDPRGATPTSPKPLDVKAIALEMIQSPRLSLRRHGAQLRPGKTAGDLREALKRARAFGRGRDDFTLAMLEAHLKHLLQSAPRT